jgi:hypothetical protein
MPSRYWSYGQGSEPETGRCTREGTERLAEPAGAMENRRVSLLRRAASVLPDFRGKRRIFWSLMGGMGVEAVKLDGILVELDLADSFERLAAIGLYQPEILNALRTRMRPGECFCDCGAHVGLI